MPLIPDGCTCRWYEVRIPGEPHIPPMSEAEPDPLCPAHFPPRWKVACINWGIPDAPRALIYLLLDGEAHLERYFDTWADAVSWLTDRGPHLEAWAARLLKVKRDYLADKAVRDA